MNPLPCPKITDDFANLEEFMAKCETTGSLDFLVRERVQLVNLPTYSLDDLRACGIKFGPAKKIHMALRQYCPSIQKENNTNPTTVSPVSTSNFTSNSTSTSTSAETDTTTSTMEPEDNLWHQMMVQEMKKISQAAKISQQKWQPLIDFQKKYRRQHHISAMDLCRYFNINSVVTEYLHSSRMVPCTDVSTAQGQLYPSLEKLMIQSQLDDHLPVPRTPQSMHDTIREICAENRGLCSRNDIVSFYWDDSTQSVVVSSEGTRDVNILASILNQCNMETAIDPATQQLVDFRNVKLSVQQLLRC